MIKSSLFEVDKLITTIVVVVVLWYENYHNRSAIKGNMNQLLLAVAIFVCVCV